MFDLKGKVAVVTGATGVLCSEISKALGQAGVTVVLACRTKEKAEKLSRETEGSYWVCCDVLNKESLEKAYNEIIEKSGKIDILINGAGGNTPGATTDEEFWTGKEDVKSFFNLGESDFKGVFDLNIIGTLLPTQVFTKAMVGKGGVVINISSMSAFSPLTKVPAYSAAKAAVSNFTEWLAVHFAPAKVRVNAIAPGFFITEQNRFLLTKEDGSLSERGHKIINKTPMKRFGVPGDLVGAVMFLASEEASFVTGVVLPVDGGFNAYSGV
ncbi:MAG: SDR family oxidoreductase [Abditibacteriota bacterium]|nr:SDR family oxidoreductase [Abditibacteriota bacterium]